MSGPGRHDDRPLHEQFGFDIARRGYDRDQVDDYLTRLRDGNPPSDFSGFDLVRRGYERGQVDDAITRLRRAAGL